MTAFTPEQQRIIAAANARADADCAAAFAAAGTHAESPQAARSPGGEPLTRQAPSRRATIAAGELDVIRVSGTDRGHTTAALEGHPVSPFDSGTPAALTAPGVESLPPPPATPGAPTLFDQPAARWTANP